MELHEGEKFLNRDFTGEIISKFEYERCEFVNCNFNKCNLSNNDFVECTFKGCNLSLVLLGKTGLKNIVFVDCKLIGIDFSKCENFLFETAFEKCQLDYASFYQKKMKKTKFNHCSMKETDFAETDLTQASFNDCDLESASFVRSILEKTDFRTARNYIFDPEVNRVKGARFSLEGVAGLLTKYEIEIEL